VTVQIGFVGLGKISGNMRNQFGGHAVKTAPKT
jgi:hypothetical protein